MQCTQKLASVTLCPQQEPTASSKRMLSPANSLDIYMEKHQKRAKDEHGVACLTDGRSINYLNSKMAEVTRQRKLMLVRQSCTTEPVDSPIETEAPPLSPPKPENASEDDVKPMSPDCTGLAKETCTIIPEETSTIQSVPVSKMQYREEQKWLLAKSPMRLSNFSSGQVKLTASVSVVNPKDSHRLSFPSLKTTTTYTWCFLMRRRSLHVQQTDMKISAYSAWSILPNNPNPLGLPTKVVMSLFDSKQSSKKLFYTSAIKTSGSKDVLSYAGKLKDVMPKLPLPQKSKSSSSRSKILPELQSNLESEKELTTKSEPRRVKIFDGGYKSNEEYVYVRGRGRGKYICEECGIRCKKPSMLRKHIRTHSDVRPYHCNHCNFSFKTKGNLTKHMKSKAHSKKCLEMGVSVGPIDDQDAEDSGDRSHVSSADRQDSDDSDEDDDNEEEEEDSQAESGLSTNPSVSASPQHFPGRDMDAPPSALLAQMSISSALMQQHAENSVSDSESVPMLSPKQLNHKGALGELSKMPSAGVVVEVSDTESVHMMSPVSPCRQMSIDFPDFEAPPTSPPAPCNNAKAARVSLPPTTPASDLPQPVDRGTQTSTFPVHTPLLFPQNTPSVHGAALPHTHLFSHLPLHSQQPPRSSYSSLPLGGIQLLPTYSAYSTFVPIQGAQVQLTIPAVLHRNTSPLSPQNTNPSGENQPFLLPDQNNAVPCFPVTQTLQPLNLESLNIIANSGLAQTQLIQPQGLTLNATLGLQVLAASPTSQSSGLQIVNIAAIIPSVSPVPTLSPILGSLERWDSSETPGQNPGKMMGSPTVTLASILPMMSSSQANVRHANVSHDNVCPTNVSQANVSHANGSHGNLIHANMVLANTKSNKLSNAENLELNTMSEGKNPESRFTKPAKTSMEDYHETSSDDEDRLVIAT
ncbi:unnamed protein product [Knipowitschia caucasica]